MFMLTIQYRDRRSGQIIVRNFTASGENSSVAVGKAAKRLKALGHSLITVYNTVKVS